MNPAIRRKGREGCIEFYSFTVVRERHKILDPGRDCTLKFPFNKL